VGQDMLPKKNRVDKKGVDLIFKKGRFVASSSFTFKFILTSSSFQPRISFITPKSISKLAVKRNLLRRKGYSALKKYINQFPFGVLGVFVFKKYQDNVLTIENEIKDILNKIN
jgi:ribonuclease P protein component